MRGRPEGRPPKPVEQKRKLGNPGRRPLPAPMSTLPMARETPDPPRPLGQAGRALWDRVWGSAAAWLAPNTDTDLILILCEQIDERSVLRLQVLRDGDWRARLALRQLDAQVVTGLSLLGFTPTDRARIGGGEVRRDDEFDQFRARQAARKSGGGVGS